MANKKKQRRARGEGSVHFNKPKGCWIWRAVTGHKPDGRVLYTEGRAPTQAAALERKRKAEGSNRRPTDKQRTGDYLEYWLTDVSKPNVRNNTWRRYEQVVRLHLKPHIGGIPIQALTVATINRLWSTHSRAGMKPGTIRTCSAVLSTALEHAAREGVLTASPTRLAVRPQVRRDPIEVFSDDEVKAIIAAATANRLEPLFLLAISTGARMGELLALELLDVDLVVGTIHIRRMLDKHKGKFSTHPPKSETGVRVIGLPAFALDALRAHCAHRSDGPLFTTRSGQYIARGHVSHQGWVSLLQAAKVPYRKLHALRHTHASRLLAAGVDPAEVAKRLGDRIETIMRYYAHWINTANRDTAAKVQEIYAQGGEEGANHDTKRRKK